MHKVTLKTGTPNFLFKVKINNNRTEVSFILVFFLVSQLSI